MSPFRSGFSKLIERFIEYRKASGSWNEPCYGLNIKLFDHFCADNDQSSSVLTQEMVDAWCAKRDTETNRSYETRTRVIRTFIDYLRSGILRMSSLQPRFNPSTIAPLPPRAWHAVASSPKKNAASSGIPVATTNTSPALTESIASICNL